MIYIFVNIEKIKNTLREFQAENSWEIKNTQADFKKLVSYKKKKCINCRQAETSYSICLDSTSKRVEVLILRNCLKIMTAFYPKMIGYS